MSGPDLINIGLSEAGNDKLDRLKEMEYFAEKMDGYRFAVSLARPTSMPSLRSSPWILGAPHNGLAILISRISRRISNGTVGRPQRRRDFQRQYDLKPARCQRITVSGRTIASASYILGNSRQAPPNISLSIEMNGGLLELARRSTLICCLSTKISASSATTKQIDDHAKHQFAQI
jgi:hypothetical protein